VTFSPALFPDRVITPYGPGRLIERTDEYVLVELDSSDLVRVPPDDVSPVNPPPSPKEPPCPS
jgi:hypothetical protein